jgi:hypothetical protein
LREPEVRYSIEVACDARSDRIHLDEPRAAEPLPDGKERAVLFARLLVLLGRC